MFSNSSLVNQIEISNRNPQNEFEIQQKIGSGTYGDVYKAKKKRTKEIAAIKIINLDSADDFSLLQQEILMMKDCKHTNIVTYFGSYVFKEKLWICMEYCGGGSLQNIYHEIGPLTELQICYTIRETLSGLCYLHRRGKMHRDIKGANILLTECGRVKLADFGVSAQITATISKRKSFIGTPYWMAPEVAAVEKKGGYNHLCDIWACGITAIELAELQPPMFDLHPMRVLLLMAKSGYKPPSLRDKNKWTTDFHLFIKDVLQKNPKKRPPADKLLMKEMSPQITMDLLQKAQNPTTNSDFSHEETEEPDLDSRNNLPARIKSKSPDKLEIKNKQLLKTEETEQVESSKPTCSVCNRSNCDSFECAIQTLLMSDSVDESNQKQSLSKRNSANDVYNFNTNGSSSLAAECNPKHRTLIGSSDASSSGQSLNRPVAPPRKYKKRQNSSFQIESNGLPPTPQVYMGACFSKVFNESPLNTYCTTSWVHPETHDQHILLAAEEGIYDLNLNALHDSELNRLYPRRTVWMYVVNDILISLSGKNLQLFRHDLLALYSKQFQRFSTTMKKMPEKFMPKKFSPTTKMLEMKNCLKCSIVENFENKYKFLCVISSSSSICLMQWYLPLKKFMIIKQIDLNQALSHVPYFELITKKNREYPLLCTYIYDLGDENSNSSSSSGGGGGGGSGVSPVVRYKLQMIDFNDDDMLTEVVSNLNANPARRIVDFVQFRQMDSDTVLIAYDNLIRLITLSGLLAKHSWKFFEFRFDFKIFDVVCLKDSILVFHKHGVQGRSLKIDQITQEITDYTKKYRLLGSDKMLVLESEQEHIKKSNGDTKDLHILAGHEASY